MRPRAQRRHGALNPALEAKLRAVVRAIDGFNDWLGARIISLFILVLLYAVCHEVIARYVFDAPTDWSYELTYMLYGSFFMLGAAYTLLKGGHVRTDIFYNNWSARTRGIVDAVLYLFAFFPGMVFFLWIGGVEAMHAIEINERSDATPWAPSLVPFKLSVPVSAALLIAQGVSEFLKSLYAALEGVELEPRPQASAEV